MLIFLGVFTREAMKNRRSLEAYQLFQSGWVGTVFILQCNKNTVFKANVKPSQRVNAEPHHPWAAADKDGNIICAHCNCMAG